MSTRAILIGVVTLNIALSAFLGVVLTTQSDTSAQPEFEPPVIAVIDVEAVVDGMARRGEMEKEIRAELESRLAGIEGLKQAVLKLEGEIKLLKAGSSAHQTKEKELVFKRAEVELEQRKVADDLEAKRNQRFGELLAEIRLITDSYCEERGIDLVFQQKLTIQPGMPSWESVFRAPEVYHITDSIIEILNKE